MTLPGNRCLKKGTYTNVPSSTIHNGPQSETTKCPPTVKRMNKWRYIPWCTTHAITRVSQTSLEWKKPSTMGKTDWCCLKPRKRRRGLGLTRDTRCFCSAPFLYVGGCYTGIFTVWKFIHQYIDRGTFLHIFITQFLKIYFKKVCHCLLLWESHSTFWSLSCLLSDDAWV